MSAVLSIAGPLVEAREDTTRTEADTAVAVNTVAVATVEAETAVNTVVVAALEMLLANSPNRPGWAESAGIGSMAERDEGL